MNAMNDPEAKTDIENFAHTLSSVVRATGAVFQYITLNQRFPSSLNDYLTKTGRTDFTDLELSEMEACLKEAEECLKFVRNHFENIKKNYPRRSTSQ